MKSESDVWSAVTASGDAVFPVSQLYLAVCALYPEFAARTALISAMLKKRNKEKTCTDTDMEGNCLIWLIFFLVNEVTMQDLMDAKLA